MNTYKELSPKSVSLISAVLLAVAVTFSLFFNNLDPIFLALTGFSLIGFTALTLWQSRLPGWQQAFWPLVLLTLFWLWTLFSGLAGKVNHVSFNTVLAFAALPLTAWSVVLLGWTHRFASTAMVLLSLIAVSLAIYGCTQFFILEIPPRATFLNRNNFAAFQIPLVLVAITGLLNPRASIPSRGLCVVVITLLSFVIGLIGSRGALLALALGSLLTLGAAGYLRFPRKRLAAVTTLILVSVIAANIAGSGKLGDRLSSMSDPVEAGKDRFSIWEGSLDLAAEAPWYGTGPGTFFLTYPRFRLDADSSAAMYVHNDYLQLWIEAGWPSVVLLLSAALAAFFFACRFLVDHRAEPVNRALAFALISGIGAVMGHSLLTFNLYLIPILIELGLLFGFLALLVSAKSNGSGVNAQSGSRLPVLLRIVLILALALPGTELVRILTGTHHFNTGIELFQTQKPHKALDHLREATEWWPEADLYHYTLAWQAFQLASKSFGGPKTELLNESLTHLNTAQSLNPYRPQPHLIRALVFRQFPEQAAQKIHTTTADGPLPESAAEQELRQAVSKDPFYLQARFRLARLLLEQNRVEEGLQILEAGLGKDYSPSTLSMNYFRLTAEIRRIVGDQDGYLELLESVKDVRKRMDRERQKEAERIRRLQGMF